MFKKTARFLALFNCLLVCALVACGPSTAATPVPSPFSLLYPKDGLVVTEASIPVVGVTFPGAIVGVNGIPVEVNELGVFSTTVPLKKGANLIEVVATDMREVRFQTVVVFYTP